MLARLLPLLATGMIAPALLEELTGPPEEDPPRTRNGYRWLSQVGIVTCHHRKGGFGYEEFPDDAAESPDITVERPGERIDPIEAQIECNPNKVLTGFTDQALALRKAALRRWLDKLLQNAERLREERDAARDDGDTDAQGRAQVALDRTVEEARCVRTMLYNTVVECWERAEEGSARKGELFDEGKALQDLVISKS